MIASKAGTRLALLAFVVMPVIRAQAFADGSFEAQSVGTAFSGPWVEGGGTASAILSAPALGFPTDGSLYAQLHPQATGPYTLGCTVPPNGAAAWISQTFGSCVRVTTISFDWTWVCAETVNSGQYNDFMAVRICTVTGTHLADVLYVDTRDGNGPGPACPSAGVSLPIAFANGPAAAAAGELLPFGPKTATLDLSTVPSYSPGTVLRLYAICGNRFDNGFPSIGYLDHLVVQTVPLGGNGQPNSAAARLEINTAGNGTCPGPFQAAVPAGGTIDLVWSGPAAQAVALFVGPPAATPFALPCVGSIDIGTAPFFPDIGIVFNGALPTFPDVLFRLGSGGSTSQSFSIPTLPSGTLLGWVQGVVLQPVGAPCSVVLTSAFRLSIS